MTTGPQTTQVDRSRWQRKLRGRSLAEVAVRGRQELAKLGERVLAGTGREASDTAFLRSIAPAHRRGTAEATASALLDRLRAAAAGDRTTPATFFTATRHVDEIVEVMRERYPAETRATLERADRAIAGEFALLGLERASFGFPIDWHLEPISGRRTPLAHWSAIDYLNPAVAGDKKVTWELNRHAHFVTLAQAYRLTGDERYARALVDQARGLAAQQGMHAAITVGRQIGDERPDVGSQLGIGQRRSSAWLGRWSVVHRGQVLAADADRVGNRAH